MKIITDHKWKPFRYRDEVPAAVLASEFDYQDDDTLDGYFKYRGHWHHLDGFMRTEIDGWHGLAEETAFSGVLLEVSDDGESYRIGLALS